MSAAVLTESRLSLGGILISEWIKLRTLRSSEWCLLVFAVLTIGAATLISLVLTGLEHTGFDTATANYNWFTASTVAVGFGVLVVGVLGSLVITGEYGTGMIRSSVTAVPRRLPVLFAKAAVIGVATFVAALVSLVLAALASAAILSGAGYPVDIADGQVWVSITANAGYLALVAVLAVGVGAVIRVSAGAIATVLGLILVVPTVFQLIGGLTQQTWPINVAAFLPSSLGGRMAAFPGIEGIVIGDNPYLVLEPWQAALAMVAWAAVALAGGALLLARRDV
ncbi:ABC transporter permease [Protaetiibacter larvae]|uniref:ABC transporter permease subunit n=1 Tax=Protaetiibacter larvae TaxID=2592654 RepID=A0A5C1Y662_9MICO|nr:ABC transporter permease [Protaetiibacter larvae]QEO09384.1 ABC transporter permease subunit [Protaetiibacter larvae]